MLTQDEVQCIIDAAINKRDKAVIALLWDMGAQIGEVGNLCIKNVKHDYILLLTGNLFFLHYYYKKCLMLLIPLYSNT
jgi:hypothetical protein